MSERFPGITTRVLKGSRCFKKASITFKIVVTIFFLAILEQPMTAISVATSSMFLSIFYVKHPCFLFRLKSHKL